MSRRSPIFSISDHLSCFHAFSNVSLKEQMLEEIEARKSHEFMFTCACCSNTCKIKNAPGLLSFYCGDFTCRALVKL